MASLLAAAALSIFAAAPLAVMTLLVIVTPASLPFPAAASALLFPCNLKQFKFSKRNIKEDFCKTKLTKRFIQNILLALLLVAIGT